MEERIGGEAGEWIAGRSGQCGVAARAGLKEGDESGDDDREHAHDGVGGESALLLRLIDHLFHTVAAEGAFKGLRRTGVLFERAEKGVDALDAVLLSGFARRGLEEPADSADEFLRGSGWDGTGFRGGGRPSEKGPEEAFEVRLLRAGFLHPRDGRATAAVVHEGIPDRAAFRGQRVRSAVQQL